MAPADFAAMVKELGLEDSGELIELATTEQIVTAFDEDLFVNERPGQREVFDPTRFALWLEVMVEADPKRTADRVKELPEDFVVSALSSLVMVLDSEELMMRMGEGGESSRMADKAIESSLSEELDGYLLISRQHEGWDAVMELVLRLDRDDRSFLERILDRCSVISSVYIDDLDELVTALNDAESLAEDVEAQREERRVRQGHVEPRAAKAFLDLSGRQPGQDDFEGRRDPITAAYFRDHAEVVGPEHRRSATAGDRASKSDTPEIQVSPMLLASGALSSGREDLTAGFLAALGELRQRDDGLFSMRMRELAYLANVLAAADSVDGRRLTPYEAAQAALKTVALGAHLEAAETDGNREPGGATLTSLVETLSRRGADILFRRASRRGRGE